MKNTLPTLICTACLALSANSFAGNITASREITLDRERATVWKLIGEFNSLDVWLPPVIGSTSADVKANPGAIRVLRLGNNASVTEKLLTYDKEHYRYSYAFIESPLPVKNYVAWIKLDKIAEGKTRVTWQSTFDADGVSDDKARNAILGIYDAGFGKLAQIFNSK